MSISVMSWVWAYSQAEGADLLVLLAIADNAQDNGGGAWPSVKTLAGKARVSERTVQRCIKSLTDIGELSVAPGAGKNGVNVYAVIMKARQNVTPSQSHPVRLSGVTPVTRRGDTRVTGGVTHVSPKPSFNHQEPSEREPSPFCSKHPNGTEKPCGPCGTAKLKYSRWSKSQGKRAATSAKALQNCRSCHGTGFVEDDQGKPIRKCTDHLRAAAG